MIMMDRWNDEPLEIERKFLIRFPDLQALETLCSKKAKISQTYLCSGPGKTRRIRRSESFGKTDCGVCHYYTEKEKISNITRIEREREITKDTYDQLMEEADPEAQTIHKTRYYLPSGDLCFEVDVFPEWKDRAFCEVELEDEAGTFEIPECLELIREVTDDPRYTNASLARNGFEIEL